VAIVLIPDFAAELEGLARRMPVWVVDTPANRAAADRLRRASPDLDLTVFRAAPGYAPEEICADVLGTVELHHGPYSRDPPCGALEVVGAAASPRVREALSAEGFAVVAERPGGFVATRLGGAKESGVS
jgi:hypothetical protein